LPALKFRFYLESGETGSLIAIRKTKKAFAMPAGQLNN
jgi:hypothetical protein